MKKSLPLIFLGFLGFLFFAPKAHAATYAFYRSITTTSTTAVASGTNSNFPFLVSSTVSSWASASHGGHVQNLVTAPNGGQEPADLAFATSSANCNGTPLNFETESYNSSTGALIDWVNVPSLSAGTAIYACYDDSGTTTDQSHPSSTWNSNYLAVWHFPTIGTSTLGLNDSTANPINGANHGGSLATTTIIDGGYNNPFSGGSGTNWVSIPAGTGSKLDLQRNFSANAWVNLSTPSCGASASCAIISMNGGGWYFRVTQSGANGLLDFLQSQTVDLGQSTGHITLNAWQYVGFTLSSGGSGTFYINGVPAGTFSVGVTFNNSGGGNIFGDNGGTHEELAGDADELEVASGVFSPSWEITTYSNQSSPSTFYAVGSETAAGGGGGGSVIQMIFRWIMSF